MRDSTASFLQHWCTLLSVKQEYVDKLNLSGDIWYDTYTFIIETFLNKNTKYLNNDIIKPILKRNILKNFIMITNYNATIRTCRNNLNEKLNEQNLNIDSDELKIFSEEFFSFLKDDIFNIIFLHKKNEVLKNIGTLYETDDKSQINLTYLNYKEVKEDIKIYKLRWVILKRVLIDTVCFRKTRTALNANIVQANDAELARNLICELNIQSVHDSFAINLYEVHKLVDTTNLFFNKKLNNNYYSIFILI